MLIHMLFYPKYLLEETKPLIPHTMINTPHWISINKACISTLYTVQKASFNCHTIIIYIHTIKKKEKNEYIIPCSTKGP